MKIAKLFTVGQSIAAVIPAAYRRELGWLPGDHCELAINKGQLILRNLRGNAIKTRKSESKRGANDLTKVTASLRAARR